MCVVLSTPTLSGPDHSACTGLFPSTLVVTLISMEPAFNLPLFYICCKVIKVASPEE